MVSHSANDIAKFCDKVIVLEAGKSVFSGGVKEGVDYYHQRYQSLEEQKNKTKIADSSKPVGTENGVLPFLHPLYENADAISNLNISINGRENCHRIDVKSVDKLTVDISFDLTEESDRLHVGMPVWKEDAVLVCAFSSRVDEVEICRGEKGRTSIALNFDVSYFNPGVYHMVLAIIDGNEFLYRQPILTFEVHPSSTGYWGIVCLPGQWRSGDSAE